MLLNQVKEKATIVITGFNENRSVRKRLMDMGLKIGAEFKIILIRRNGSMVLYNEDLKIVLDRLVAGNIVVADAKPQE